MKRAIILTFITLSTLLIVAGCGAKSSDSNTSSSAGGNEERTYMVASDATYAPMEFMDKDKSNRALILTFWLKL